MLDHGLRCASESNLSSVQRADVATVFDKTVGQELENYTAGKKKKTPSVFLINKSIQQM